MLSWSRIDFCLNDVEICAQTRAAREREREREIERDIIINKMIFYTPAAHIEYLTFVQIRLSRTFWMGSLWLQINRGVKSKNWTDPGFLPQFFVRKCQENHQAFLMEMLDNLSEYTQSKTHVIRMIDNEPENQHRETDVDRNLCP